MSEHDAIRMYDLVGGDEKLHELVDRFYDLMDLETGFAELRAMHPPSLEISREKLYRFLSGWTGFVYTALRPRFSAGAAFALPDRNLSARSMADLHVDGDAGSGFG